MICVAQYLRSPGAAVAQDGFSPEAAACFQPFLTPWCVLAPLRWLAVTATRRKLLKTNCLKPFTVHLLWKGKTQAYMHDDGRVFLSAGLLQTGSAMTVLSVYCHELSHIKLSQREDYPAIKALQREFNRQFSDHKLCQLLSPIEYYAMLLSRSALTQLVSREQNARQRQKLVLLQKDLEEKIQFLEQELENLANNYGI